MNYLLTINLGNSLFAVIDAATDCELFAGSLSECKRFVDALVAETIETAEATEIEAEFVTDEDYTPAF